MKYEFSNGIYYDSSNNIFFFLNEQGEEVECDSQGVRVFPLSLIMCRMNLCNGVHALDETIPCPHCAEVTA